VVGNANILRAGGFPVPPPSATPVPANERNVQTHVPPALLRALRLHVASRGTLLKDVYEAAIEEFAAYRAQVLGRGADVPYRASPRGSVKLNVRIPPSAAATVDRIAGDDNIAARRVLFTAISRYAEAHRIVARPG
jgi:hypothetical protein